MNSTIKKELIKMLLEKGKKIGFTDMEIYIQSGSSMNIKIFKTELDNYGISKSEGVSFRGVYNGNMGYSYSEKVDKSSVDLLVNEALENAKVLEAEEKEYIYEGSKEYKKVDIFNEKLSQIDTKEKINLAYELEQEAFKQDSRVESVSNCIYAESEGYSYIENSKGLKLEQKSNLAYAYLGVKVKESEDIKTAGKYIVSNNFNKIDVKRIAKEAVDEAVSMLGAEKVNSGKYEILFRHDAMADLLISFVSIFSAEAVQKDLSLLKGRLGEKIADSKLNIIDNPFLEHGTGTAGFDSEGVATKYKKILENGTLKTFLHSLKTAKKDGVEPTGNGFKGYKSSVSIGPTNIYIDKGNIAYEDIIKTMNNGIIIIDLQGLHSGLNSISGDFSLSAYGYLVEGGKIVKPVDQITVAGNFFEMINDIEYIGNDLKFVLPGDVGSPSVKISSLDVSGK